MSCVQVPVRVGQLRGKGRVIGIWRRAIKKGSVIITPMPFNPLTDEEHMAFATAAQGYADFLGMPMGLSFEVS